MLLATVTFALACSSKKSCVLSCGAPTQGGLSVSADCGSGAVEQRICTFDSVGRPTQQTVRYSNGTSIVCGDIQYNILGQVVRAGCIEAGGATCSIPSSSPPDFTSSDFIPACRASDVDAGPTPTPTPTLEGCWQYLADGHPVDFNIKANGVVEGETIHAQWSRKSDGTFQGQGTLSPGWTIPLRSVAANWTLTFSDPAHLDGTISFMSGSPEPVHYVSTDCAFAQSTGTWNVLTQTGAPAPTLNSIAAWTGTEMLIWGGTSTTSALYDPKMDSWRPASIQGGPSSLKSYILMYVWAGDSVIAWDGSDQMGWRYDPVADRWSPISKVGSPTARWSFNVSWTGTELMVWGGTQPSGVARFADGGLYDPKSDTWRTVSNIGAPSARSEQFMVWSGSEVLVWGGWSQQGCCLVDGARYDPAGNKWTRMSSWTGMIHNDLGPAAWTGKKAVFWAGSATAAAYDPVADSWTPLNATGSPPSANWTAWAWTGKSLFVWGGADGSALWAEGGLYYPDTDSWLATARVGLSPRTNAKAFWTGAEVLVWGGSSALVASPETSLGALGRFVPP